MTNNITALVIPTEGLPHLTSVQADDGTTYSFISNTIGGHIDAVYGEEGDHHGYVHDEGLLIGLPINVIASALFGRVLAGPCVVFGRYNAKGQSDGSEYSVPGKVIERIEYLAGAYKMWLESRPVTIG